MKKFIKYNLTFILLFTIFFTSINIAKAVDYQVSIRDGCIYTCGQDEEGLTCKDLVSFLPYHFSDKSDSIDYENSDFRTLLQQSNGVPEYDLKLIEKARKEIYSKYLKDLNFYYEGDITSVDISKVKFSYNGNDYNLQGDLEIVDYYQAVDYHNVTKNHNHIKLICNKNEEGDLKSRCFPIMLYYDFLIDFKDKKLWGGWGSYKNNPSICEDNRSFYGDIIEDNTDINSCFDLKDEDSCKTDNNFSCIWVNKNGGYCNVDNLQYIECGDAFDIPSKIPPITSFIINFLKIVTPIVLIVVSIISLVKAIMASKEDEMQKATQGLKKKVIAAVMVFFVINIVQFVIFKVADSSETGSIGDCLSCFINNSCEGSEYFKTNVNGRYECHYLSDINKTVACPEDKR